MTVMAVALSACATMNTPNVAVDENPAPQTLDYQALLAAPVRPATDLRQRIVQTASAHLGDLIYFTVPQSRSFHVGLYLGEGRFIHAPGATTAVRTDTLGDMEWRSRFLGARQILPN